MTEGLQPRGDEAETGRGRPPVVVVGVDGSPASRCAALTAGSSARALGGTVVAVHVPTQSPWQSIAASIGAGQALIEARELACRQVEAELAALFDLVDVPWRFVVGYGAVDAALTRVAAELQAAVVVVGTPSRTLRARLTHLVVPNVPRRLLRSGSDRILIA